MCLKKCSVTTNPLNYSPMRILMTCSRLRGGARQELVTRLQLATLKVFIMCLETFREDRAVTHEELD